MQLNFYQGLLGLLLGGPLFPAAQLGGIRIGRRARTENPAGNQPEEQYGGDIDEVSGRHGLRRRQEEGDRRQEKPDGFTDLVQ